MATGVAIAEGAGALLGSAPGSGGGGGRDDGDAVTCVPPPDSTDSRRRSTPGVGLRMSHRMSVRAYQTSRVCSYHTRSVPPVEPFMMRPPRLTETQASWDATLQSNKENADPNALPQGRCKPTLKYAVVGDQANHSPCSCCPVSSSHKRGSCAQECADAGR